MQFLFENFCQLLGFWEQIPTSAPLGAGTGFSISVCHLRTNSLKESLEVQLPKWNINEHESTTKSNIKECRRIVTITLSAMSDRCNTSYRCWLFRRSFRELLKVAILLKLSYQIIEFQCPSPSVSRTGKNIHSQVVLP